MKSHAVPHNPPVPSPYLHAVPLGRRLFFEEGLTYSFTGPPPSPGDWVAAPLRTEVLPALVMQVGVDLPPKQDPLKIKPILGPVANLPPWQPFELELARFLSWKYFTPLGVVLKNMTTFGDLRLLEDLQPGPNFEGEPALKKELKKPYTSKKILGALKRLGLDLTAQLDAGIFTRQFVVRSPDAITLPADYPLSLEHPTLREEQAAVVQPIAQMMTDKQHRTFLIQGVTGSGKTEVYLALAENALETGQGALLLFPEIALTTQMIGRLTRRFGQRLVHFHSQQSDKQRKAGQAFVAANPASVVIGPRSALFVRPFSPALIILDEEHDGSYKQDQDPRYLAVEVAEFLAKSLSIPLVLGSATPSLETRYRADQGEVTRLELKERHGGTDMPQIRLIDMKDAHNRGLRGSVTPELKEAVQNTLKEKNQALIFINRRGYHTTTLCQNCGYLFTCEHCSVALTLHREKGKKSSLRCHYCDYEVPPPTTCPACLSPTLREKGIGTQKAEEELEQLFHEAKVLRVDRDATKTTQDMEQLFSRMESGEVDLMVGTQMIAKGLDFPKLKLVGVLDADRQLHLPDFRSAERTFQHLVQVSGRSGRRQEQGQVYIQTLVPTHPVFLTAQAHDYEAFYRYELEQRHRHGYPPFTHQIKMMVIDKNQPKVVGLALGLKDQFEKLKARFKERGREFTLRGPSPAPLSKLQDDYRWQLAISSTDPKTAHSAVKLILQSMSPGQRPLIRVDVEPQDWL